MNECDEKGESDGEIDILLLSGHNNTEKYAAEKSKWLHRGAGMMHSWPNIRD